MFSSDEAIRHATCLAQCWQCDAVLDSVSSGRRESLGGDRAPAGAPTVQEDGRTGQWIVTFASPTALCGPQSFETKTFTVQSNGTLASGSSCFPVADGCQPSLRSAPPDSTSVVPAGRAKITAMAGFDPASAIVLAENFHQCGVVQDQWVNRQQWRVWSTWNQADAIHQGIVDFDAKGRIIDTRGPCVFGDLACLNR